MAPRCYVLVPNQFQSYDHAARLLAVLAVTALLLNTAFSVMLSFFTAVTKYQEEAT